MEFAESSGARTLTPLTDQSGVNIHSEFQKRASSAAVPAASGASGVEQSVMDGSLRGRANTRVEEIFVAPAAANPASDLAATEVR
jgi:hypothetical protein